MYIQKLCSSSVVVDSSKQCFYAKNWGPNPTTFWSRQLLRATQQFDIDLREHHNIVGLKKVWPRRSTSKCQGKRHLFLRNKFFGLSKPLALQTSKASKPGLSSSRPGRRKWAIMHSYRYDIMVNTLVYTS